MSGEKSPIDEKQQANEELEAANAEQKLPYPKSIFFIFSNEFCERFSYYGMRTILALYLHGFLRYSEDMSTVIYHIFVMLCYFTPFIGGVIADSWLGKYKTIFYVSILYACGNIVLAGGAYPGHHLPHAVLSLLGLVLIACGTGGIKPCVSSFGGDQFVVPQQQKELEKFFSVFYFSINAGSLLSSFFTPMLREVKCLGLDTCYPLAFGVPAILMILSIFFFVIGKPMYKIKPPEGSNVLGSVCKCITHALANKIKSCNAKDKKHWLEYADDKFDKSLIEDTKVFVKICYLFTPTIVFWALYEQQGSRWTFQASHMDGRLGSWIIQPDQMQTLNSLLCLTFIPLFESVIYPVCAKLKIIRTSLQKMSWGGFLAAGSFVLSGWLQMYMQPCYPVFPAPGESQLRIFNSIDCNLTLSGNNLLAGSVGPFSLLSDLNIPNKAGTLKEHVTITSICNNASWVGDLELNEEKASSYLLYDNAGTLDMFTIRLDGYSELDKLESANPKVRVLFGGNQKVEVVLKSGSDQFTFNLSPTTRKTKWNIDVDTEKYSVLINGVECAEKAYLEPGGVYVIMITGSDSKYDFKVFTLTPPNNMSILWQVPQYFVITAAEIMFSITGIEFSFTQAPDSMKSVISSIWLITDAFGNLIVLFIAGFSPFSNSAYEMFLYAGMMTVMMIWFVVMAMGWKYLTPPTETSNEETEEKPDDS